MPTESISDSAIAALQTHFVMDTAVRPASSPPRISSSRSRAPKVSRPRDADLHQRQRQEIENGIWYEASEKIYDANGKLVATADVPVLQVTSITCTPDARDCTRNPAPTGVSNMGVGFARVLGGPSDEAKFKTPDFNALSST